MSWTIVWQPEAMAAFRLLRGDDPAGVKEVAAAVGSLAGDWQHPAATPWGETGYLRLHIGGYRVLYRVENQTVTIYIVTVGKVRFE